MTPEEEAGKMIVELEGLLEDLRAIANGKNFSKEAAKIQLDSIKLELQYDP